MKIFHAHLLLLVAALPLTGCFTHVSVTKVQPGTNPRGFRYCLPQPVIIGTPKPDGSVTYTVDYIPDPDHEYAVNSWSFMANHTVNLTRDDRFLLTKAEVDQDTTGVLSQLAKSSGNVGASLATTVGAQKTAQKTAQMTAATNAATNVAAKQLLKDQAQAAVNSAQATLETAKASNPAGVAAAQTALTAANLQLTQAELAFTVAKNAANMDDPTATASGRASSQAYGPVIYRIVSNKETGSMRLEPIVFKVGKSKTPQRQFVTSTKSDPVQSTAATNTLSGGKLSFEVPVKGTFKDVVLEECVLKKKSMTTFSEYARPPAGNASKGTVTISVKQGIPAGDYVETIVLSTKSGQRLTSNISFTVKP